jgi:hypothetical protein
MNKQSQGTRPATDADTNPLRVLAFIALTELDKDVFRGGVLVTDAQGKPLEFRCTSAIQPTAVQKTLYGGTLRAHMCVELTARPLLDALKEKYDVVLVTQDEFIELRILIDKPLLIVSKQGSTVATQQQSDNPAKSELLSSPSGKFEPVTVTCHWQYADDTVAILPDLGSLFSRFNLIEPFTRIANALKLLHEKGVVPNR